ncbi:MAG: hypothetical protein Q7T17_13375 [Microbacterium sp.]|uniref:hypothetical protein n=1 Tax=Microbacterium sp. TaxID=51671 RepID=UPI0027265656|nr:hypothetical protein [Microbacterium sp.]MDO8383952.1 hypothetical protein [Microbacterium sp.]
MADETTPAGGPELDAPVERRRRGTRPRGNRTAITARVPDEHYAQYFREAEDLGIPIGSWATIVLAESRGLEIPEYIKAEISKAAARRDAAHRAHAEELPLPRSA